MRNLLLKLRSALRRFGLRQFFVHEGIDKFAPYLRFVLRARLYVSMFLSNCSTRSRMICGAGIYYGILMVQKYGNP
jgi:hypothetical protein